MQFSRSHRRHHRNRLLVKRRREDARYALIIGALNESQWRFVNCRKRVDTACMCSCSTCGNPRKHYGNSVRSLTQQERRWDIPLDLEMSL